MTLIFYKQRHQPHFLSTQEEERSWMLKSDQLIIENIAHQQNLMALKCVESNFFLPSKLEKR